MILMLAQKFRKEVVTALYKATSLQLAEIELLLENPPKGIAADVAFPCFSLAKQQRKPPAVIAQELAESLEPRGLIAKVETQGPYINFTANWIRLGQMLLNDAVGDRFPCFSSTNRTVLVEFPGPNTNKPLHLGHLRIGILGTAIANILRFTGNNVKRVDIINDRGIHISKSMLAYKKFGNKKYPDKKPDHFVGDYYVRYAQELDGKEGVEEALRRMLVEWEAGSPSVRKLWKQMNEWTLRGFRDTYRRMGWTIDKAYRESEHYLEGKKIVQAALKKGIFHKEGNGNIVADLEMDSLGKKVVLRGDGTSIYITQDLALAKKRYTDFKMDEMIYVVGSEQKHAFQSLFRIFDQLNFPFARHCTHVSVGMISLPSGRMKSREGIVADADTLIDKVKELAEKEIRVRGKIPHLQIAKTAEKIAVGAIVYFILSYDAGRDFLYNPEASLAFEGNTGPYLQYAHSRASSILRKAPLGKGHAKYLVEDKERAILRHLLSFPASLELAARDLRPHHLAAWTHELASLFNDFYQTHHVIGSGEGVQEARLLLTRAVQKTLAKSMELLGVPVLGRM